MNLINTYVILVITFTCARFTFTQDCTCDLTTNQCNLNCCCDSDCDETDKLAFSSCLPENTNRIEEICVSDSILYSSNNKYQAQGNGMGLFCVFKDNYETRHLYTNVPLVSTESAFNILLNQYKRSVYSVQDSSSVPTDTDGKNSFKAGDPLFILFDGTNQRRGYLPQPTVFLTNQCEDQNPARFLFANKTSCQRPIQNLTNDCTNKAFLDTTMYVDGFKVASYPSFLGGNNTALVTPTLKSVMCMFNGKTSPCQSNTIQNPTWNGTHCENVLMEVEYNVQYDANTTVEITAVDVTVVVGAISSTTTLEQSFSYKFTQKDEGASNASVTERSGNPGYIVGLPIISGIIDTTTETVNLTENATALSLITTPKDSLCSNSEMKRESLKFGIDYQSLCFYDLHSAMTTSDCDTLQQNIFNLLLPNLPDHVASFGNTLTTNAQEWVTIINTQSTVVATATNNVCTNMITDVTYQILYSKTGYFANPQNQIIGFEVKYGTPRTLQSQCSGLLCSNVNRALISQSVSFIDVSTTPTNEVKPKPKFRSKAPNDFFYPFL